MGMVSAQGFIPAALSQVYYVILLDFFEDLLNYTFLERLWSKESENQCLHLRRCVYGSHIGIYNIAAIKCMFLHILAPK